MDRSRSRKNCGHTSARRRFGLVRLVFAGEKIELTRVSRRSFLGGRERKLEPEPLREALTGFRREPFKMIVHKTPDAAGLAEMPLDLKRPAFEGGLAFPEQFPVAVNVLSFGIVLRRIIAEQPQVDEVGGGGEELERREISFVERARIRPDPTDAIFFD